MLPYWLMFLVPALRALAVSQRMRLNEHRARNAFPDGSWLIVLLILTIVIGLRYRVGGDWPAYLRYLEQSKVISLTNVLNLEDPGYWVLNILSTYLDFGILGVNLMSGMLFSAGLVVFCRNLPNPWLALSVAIPYMVVVVAMGYTRQSIALGFVLIGMVTLERHKYIPFVIFILIGAAFHKSAVIIILLAAIISTKNKLYIYILSFASLLIGYHVLLADHTDDLLTHYVEMEMQSSGAAIRLAMNFVPASLFMLWGKYFGMARQQYRLWWAFSMISIVSFLLFFIVPYSTALDRMALYIIPLQLVVFSYLPNISRRLSMRKNAVMLSIIVYYSAVLFVWLNYATHSKYWVPYTINLETEFVEPGYEVY